MSARILTLLTLIYLSNADYLFEDVYKRDGILDANDLRDIKIDKDTVITTNLPPHRKGFKSTISKKSYKQLDEEMKLKIIKKMILSKNNNKAQSKGDTSSQAPDIQTERIPEIEAEPDWAYKPIPKEVNAYVNDFRKNMTECLKEVQELTPTMQMSPKVSSPLNAECLIACVLRKSGVVDNGKIRKDNLLRLVNKFYDKDTRVMKQLERNVDRCIDLSARIQDECKRASYLNDCTNELINNNKKNVFIQH